MLNVNHHKREYLFLNLIIPILVGVCMVLPGCDSTDDQSVPSRPPVFVDNHSRGQSPEKIQQDKRLRIVAFGDSLTAGLGVPLEESYPSRLQRRIDKDGYLYRVINAGVSGDTTAGALRRLNWVLKSQPSIVIIELGANDGLRGQSVDHTYENLRQIIQRLKEAGVTVLLTGMQIPPNYGTDYTSQFEEMYPRLASEFGVTFMPFFLEGVAAHRALNQADGIHPTGAGYKVIVDNLFSALEPLLKTHALSSES